MTWIQEMYREVLTGNYGRSFDDLRQPWYAGQVGMIGDTTAATIMHTQSADFAFDSMPLPVPEGETSAGVSTGGNGMAIFADARSEEHTSELQSRFDLVCRLLLEKKKTDDHKRRSRIK